MYTIKSPAVIEHLLSTYKTWNGCRDNLPKKTRYTLGDRIDGRFLEVLELLQRASYQGAAEKLPTLVSACANLDMLKFQLRILWETRSLDDKKYAGLSERLGEAGKQMGAWKRGIETKTSA